MKLNQVASWFKQQTAYTKLAPGSKEQYDILMQQGLYLLGYERDMKEIRAAEADSLKDELEETVSKHKSDTVCRVLRRVWNVAIRHEIVTFNPFKEMGIGANASRDQLWSEHQLWQFLEAADQYDIPAIGDLAWFCYSFSQRPGDMRQLKWENWDGEFLSFTQEKTGKDMVIAAPPGIKDYLNSVVRVSTYIIVREDTGKPFTVDDYSKHFKTVREKALLPSTLQLRDLRRTGLTEHAGSGASDSELLAVSGHSNRNMLNTYQVKTKTIAKNAMNKRFGID